MTKYFFTLIISITALCNSVYCQYETVLLPEMVSYNISTGDSEIAFASSDTGYMSCYFFENDNYVSMLLQTADSGRNWQIFDTIGEIQIIHDLRFEHGRGAIAGNTENIAILGLFNSNLSQKIFFGFPQLNDILSINIVHKDSIVFYGVTNESQSCLGKIIITDDVAEISEINTIEPGVRKNIFFFNAESGWYQSGSSLVYTEDLGINQTILINQVSHFDFYDAQHGVIFSHEDNRIEFTADSGQTWNYGSPEFNYAPISLIMSTEESAQYTGQWTGNSGGVWYYIAASGHTDSHSYVHSTFFGSPLSYKAFSYKSQVYYIDSNGNLTFTFNNGNFNKLNKFDFCSNDIILFPVPASNYLQIDLSNILNTNIKLSIINDIGQTLFSSNNYSNELLTVDIVKFEPGIYTVLLSIENKFTSKRFIKM